METPKNRFELIEESMSVIVELGLGKYVSQISVSLNNMSLMFKKERKYVVCDIYLFDKWELYAHDHYTRKKYKARKVEKDVRKLLMKAKKILFRKEK